MTSTSVSRRSLVTMLLLILAPAPSWSQQIWAAWDLDLAGHAPPSHFVLTVTHLAGADVPPPMEVPWGGCSWLPETQHCAPIGCPPMGTYEFWVQAHYSEGISARSNIAQCQIVAQACVCGEPVSPAPGPPVAAQAPPPPALPPPVPAGLTLSQATPPLVQLTAADLGLRPVGAIPGTSTIPPIPPSGGI